MISRFSHDVPYSLAGRVQTLLAGLILVLNTSVVHARTKSVATIVRDAGEYTSGFTRSSPCETDLTSAAFRIGEYLPLTSGELPNIPLAEFIRRVHRAADEVNALGSDPQLPLATEHAIVRYLADLDLINLESVAPFEFELLVIFAKLHALLPDHPGRPAAIYYGIRGILEKVVNLKHDSTRVSHALVAHALDQLVRLRVARLPQIAHFEDQVRAAFEDLERLQREDALGDAEGLRVVTGLAVFAKAVPALDQYFPYEINNRAAELARRFEPIEDALRQAAQSHRATIGHARRAQIRDHLTDVLTSPQIDLMPGVRARVTTLLTLTAGLPNSTN